MRTFTLNIVKLAFLCYLLSTMPSCGVDVEVSGGTEHVVKVDEDTLDFFREICDNAEQEKEEDCIQQLIDLIESNSGKLDTKDL